MIRQATIKDAKQLKDIAKRVIEFNYTSFLGEQAVRAFIDGGQADQEIDDGLESCTVIICNGITAGFAITKESLLHLIMIDCKFQRQGYGKRLLAYIENELFKNYEKIDLQSFKDNIQASGFYINNNWAVAKEVFIPELGKIMLAYEKRKNF